MPPQTLLLDVVFSLIATEHFAEGGIVTAKPNGMVWKAEEIGPDMAMVTLSIDFMTAVGISQNLLGWKVDNIGAPTTAVPV
jgi:hypothetical protein